MSHRVVITGLGLVTPLGCGVERSWQRIIAGESGITSLPFIEKLGARYTAAGIGGLVPSDQMTQAQQICAISDRERKKMGNFIFLGMLAAHEALSHAGLLQSHENGWEFSAQQSKTGIVVGSGIGGLGEIEGNALSLSEKHSVSPFFVPMALINLIGGQIAIKYNIQGSNFSIVSACASGAHAIGESVHMIRHGMRDIMIAGGAESAVCPLGVAGFAAMKALSTRACDNPTHASAPWDKARDGFVIAEGAGIMVLESLEHARNRNAPIYGEIIGYGASCDAYHIAQPPANGRGVLRCVHDALQDARIRPEEVTYINAHATSTPVGDVAELRALEQIIPRGTKISSTKGATGHTLGAAGAIEAVFSVLSLRDQIVPPTLNLHNPEDTTLSLVRNKAEKTYNMHTVMSNSFGFGGTNAALILRNFQD